MSRIAALAVALASSIGLPPAAAATDAGQSIDRSLFIPLRAVLLKVEARLLDGRLHIGTGITVGPGIVLTNCHVIDSAEVITVSKRSGRWPVVAQHAAGRHDLCFLKVPGWRGAPIEFANTSRPPTLNAPAAAIGYTGGVEISFTEGRITGIHAFDRSWLLQISSAFTSGASGGALLDSQARLMGVLTFRLPGRRAHYYAVPAAWVQQDMPGDDDWQAVGTPIAESPFWRGEPRALPWFMQVPPLEAEARWQQVVELTRAWSDAEPASAEPYVIRARALDRLAQRAQAIDALRMATEVDQRQAAAWFELGRLLKAERRLDEYARVLASLRERDAWLADELEREQPQ